MASVPKIIIAATALWAPAAAAQYFNDFDQPPHNYWTAELHDPMTELLRSVKSGKVKIDEEPGLPLVKRLLKELDIPVESQVLVFSRTSLQRGAVTRENPRAIWFNEETYLGWMPGGRIEISSTDPALGQVFYFQRKLDDTKGAMFTRDKVCIQCHAGSATNFMPGLLGRSIFPDARGRSLDSVDSFENVHHGAPIQDRWGGWYVSGGHAGLRHMGNAVAARGAGGAEIDRVAHAATDDLGKYFDTSKYPLATSDIVAMLVLDHQISMHFELMEAHYVVRQLLSDAKLDPAKLPEELPEAVRKELAATAERVVSHLLFQNEADLGETQITGDGVFPKVFLAGRKMDSKGRSLRDFRLKGQLFNHRCSYMIYSDGFTGLPEVLKGAVYQRLRQILDAEDAPEGYNHLPAAERGAISEILGETVPGYAGG